jgi:polygalacturonase
MLDVTEFGAVGDGSTLNTEALQKAIDAAARTKVGMLRFPAGQYLTGTLFLRSHLTLYLDRGATILGSDKLEDYPLITVDSIAPANPQAKRVLLFGDGLEDVTITGLGTIDGQGDAKAFEITPPHWSTPIRPEIIVMVNCRKVTVKGITLRDSPAWVQHYLHCDDVLLQNLNVYSHVNYNNDMIDVDGCRNVRIDNCVGNTGDDAITLKSTAGRICENVTISNCRLSSHSNAIKCGTESTGGFRNITITNCVITPTGAEDFHLGDRLGFAGLALEMVDGGILESITASNLVVEGTTAPIFMRLGHCGRKYSSEMPDPDVGVFRNVSVSNVIATGVKDTGCAIAGLPDHPLRNVVLSNINIEFAGGGTREDYQQKIPHRPDCYPEATMFGKLAAYGFFVRHVDGITLSNIQLGFEAPDHRPALLCADVRNLRVDGLAAETTRTAAPLIVLRDVKQALISGCMPLTDCETFLGLFGRTRNVLVTSNSIPHARKLIQVGPEVPNDACLTQGNYLGQPSSAPHADHR